MENIDEQLTRSICSIFSSVSQETVNAIIQAVKYTGLESLSDLKFVQEEDLIRVLKPIQRRKLIKAWRAQNKQDDKANKVVKQAAKEEKVDSSSKITFLVPLSTSTTMFTASAGIPPTETSSNSPSQECKVWKQRHSLTLLHIYTNYKAELSCPGVKKQKVWKEIANEVQQKCFLNCDELQCRKQIEHLKLRYEKFKNRNISNWRMDSFLAVAKIAFENTKNPGNENYKRKQTIKEEKVDPSSKISAPSISAFSMTTTVPCSSAASSTATASTVQSDRSDDEKMVEDFKTVVSPVEASNSLLVQKYEHNLEENRSWYTCDAFVGWGNEDYKRKQTIKEEKVDPSSKVSAPSISTFSMTTTAPCSSAANSTATASTVQSDRFDDEKMVGDFKPVIPSANSSTQKWTKAKCNMLLKIYAKYKSEFSCPGVKKETVWRKIVKEVRSKGCSDCNELECRNKIDDLRCDYERLKNSHVASRKMAKQMDKTREIFETTEDPVEQSSDIHLQACGKRNKKYHLALLQVYSKYKAEFNSPDTKEHKVWEKIAREMREVFSYNCGETLCRMDLFKMKYRYECFKKNNKTGGLPYFLDEARKAFETHLNLAKTFTVRVDNLSKRVTEHNLQDLFKPFGTIAGVYTTKDKSYQCKGSGYVTFYRENEAYQAISAVDGLKYDNLTLKVGWLELS